MALKKGKATDAVAKLFSVPAVEPKEELHIPETHEAHEAEPYSAMTTQGKKGKKAQRMTMAFSEENMAYIRTMGKLESGGATAYVNRLIEADRQKNADVYRQMKALLPDA